MLISSASEAAKLSHGSFNCLSRTSGSGEIDPDRYATNLATVLSRRSEVRATTATLAPSAASARAPAAPIRPIHR